MSRVCVSAQCGLVHVCMYNEGTRGALENKKKNRSPYARFAVQPVGIPQGHGSTRTATLRSCGARRRPLAQHLEVRHTQRAVIQQLEIRLNLKRVRSGPLCCVVIAKVALLCGDTLNCSFPFCASGPTCNTYVVACVVLELSVAS